MLSDGLGLGLLTFFDLERSGVFIHKQILDSWLIAVMTVYSCAGFHLGIFAFLLGGGGGGIMQCCTL